VVTGKACSALIVLAFGLLVSCAPAQESAAPQTEPTHRQAVESTVRKVLGSAMTSVTVTHFSDRNFAWHVDAVLSSVPDTATLDKAAARVLSLVGSLDPSASPVAVTLKARQLAPPGASSAWGALDYRWEPSGGLGQNRGDVVWLFHSESAAPGTSSEGWYGGAGRGTWKDASVESLDEWSQSGTPEL